MSRQAWLVDCGRMPYRQAWDLQRTLLQARQQGRVPDVVLFVEHPHVITVGRSGRSSNILVPRDVLQTRDVDVYDVERGGDVTYHGPGQLVGYPILDLRALDEDIVRYVRLLEGALIAALETWGIAATRVRGYPGVWVGDAKVAAIGVAVKRKVTMHGFALNVDPDLSYFDLINPCGLGKPVTSMARILGRFLSLSEVRPTVAEAFARTFGLELVETPYEQLANRVAATSASAL